MRYNFEITADSLENIPIINILGDLTFDADSAVKKAYSEVLEKNPTDKLIINF